MSAKTGVTVAVDLMGAVDADVLMGVTASGFQGTVQRFVAAAEGLASVRSAVLEWPGSQF